MFDSPYKQVDKLTRHVALWGPRGSGKTWLINAFPKALIKYDSIDRNFTYRLYNYQGLITNTPVAILQPAIEATQELIVHTWQFTRRPKDAKTATPAQLVSAQTHYLQIYDLPGDSSLALTEAARMVYGKADLILIILDPTLVAVPQKQQQSQAPDHQTPIPDDFDLSFLLQDEPETQHADKQISAVLSSQEYTEYLIRLLEFLKEIGRDFQVDYCVTKKDQWPHLVSRRPIEEFFGAGMQNLIDRNQEFFKSSEYRLSVAGYLPTKEQLANFDPTTGKLKDESTWQPWRVEVPFFKFLESLERFQLEDKSSPLFQKGNLQQYISYPTFNE